MKKIKGSLLIFFGLSLLLTACKKADENEVSCMKDVLAGHNMVPYNGEDLGCRFYMELYKLDDVRYFLLGSHCADIETSPFDCEGNSSFENGIDYEYYFENAERIGIVGIQ